MSSQIKSYVNCRVRLEGTFYLIHSAPLRIPGNNSEFFHENASPPWVAWIEMCRLIIVAFSVYFNFKKRREH